MKKCYIYFFVALSKEEKQQLIGEYRLHEKDRGSVEVQVALLTSRINYISEHLKQHKKDYHCRRGLLILVNRRKKLLEYLKRKNKARYTELIKRLQIRK